MIILLSVGIGIGWGFQTTVGSSLTGTITTTQTSSVSQTQEPYALTLVLTTGNTYNSSVGDQPAFYVLTPTGLRSSANIVLPTGRLIKLMIVNYDEGNASLTDPQYANVEGTVNGTITYVSNSNVNSSQASTGIAVKGGLTVTKVAPSDIAHTFTIPSLGINVPIPVSSTVTAYFKIDKAGTYTWTCETTCGSGATGLEGAMATPGWMVGNIEAEAASQVAASSQVSGTTQSGPYMLNLVEIMGNEWNSTAGAQPQFSVLGSHGLESSASISLPVNTLIQVTILSYDTPTPNSTPDQAKVTGTVGGKMYLINGTTASMSNMSQIMSPWGANVTSVPVGQLAHTFSIPSLGINIPVIGGSVEIAYIIINQPGTYTWVCLTPCGLGANGLQGAMEAPGWMTGNIEAS
jgi:heme/copper-type cytochrome/quinol oxidase subunit 2